MNNDPHKNLKSLLEEALELKNVNYEKLAQITGIPERYIWAIQNIDVEKLPASPYVRGYIKKISEVLQLNHDELWDLYKKELERKQSGAYDLLPANRFAIKYPSKTSILIVILIIVLGVYIFLGLNRLTGTPKLVINYPNEEIATVFENKALLAGTLNQRDKLTVNGEEVVIGNDNTFNHEYVLQPGLNVIEFKAQRFLGREITAVKKILYLPQTNL